MRELRVDLKHNSSQDPNHGFYSRILCIPIFLWSCFMFLISDTGGSQPKWMATPGVLLEMTAGGFIVIEMMDQNIV